jgi:hypothetical protein
MYWHDVHGCSVELLLLVFVLLLLLLLLLGGELADGQLMVPSVHSRQQH